MDNPIRDEANATEGKDEASRCDADLKAAEGGEGAKPPERIVGNIARKKRKDDLEVTIAPGLGSSLDVALGPPR